MGHNVNCCKTPRSCIDLYIATSHVILPDSVRESMYKGKYSLVEADLHPINNSAI